MGEVHRAVDKRKRDRIVALKRLPPGLVDDAGFKQRFLREAELTAQLREPHIIPIHDYGEIDGRAFLDMRLVDGLDLSRYLGLYGPLPIARTVDITVQIASALDAAHGEGLIHRDVKPSNVLLDRPGLPDGDDAYFAYLIDFGISANILASTRHSVSAIAGTAAYMAPERFSGSGDHRVDVYALGCVLFEILTDELPFGSHDLPRLLAAHLNNPPPRPSEIRPSLPAEIDEVVARAMAKNPDDRYASAGDLARSVRRVLAPGLARAPQPGGKIGSAQEPPSALPRSEGIEEAEGPDLSSATYSRLYERRAALAGALIAAGLAIATIVFFVLPRAERESPAVPVMPPSAPTALSATTSPTTSPTSAKAISASPLAANSQKTPIGVYNNSTQLELSGKVGDKLRSLGWNVVETGNYAQGVVPVCTAFYTPGTPEQPAADAIAQEFGMRSEPRFPGIANASPKVVVIVNQTCAP